MMTETPYFTEYEELKTKYPIDSVWEDTYGEKFKVIGYRRGNVEVKCIGSTYTLELILNKSLFVRGLTPVTHLQLSLLD